MPVLNCGLLLFIVIIGAYENYFTGSLSKLHNITQVHSSKYLNILNLIFFYSKAFSINGRPTIISRSDPNEILGQYNGLSVIDVKQLRKLYQYRGPIPTEKPRIPCESTQWAAYCGFWKDQGYCKSTSKYSSWMVKHCSVCGKCE